MKKFAVSHAFDPKRISEEELFVQAGAAILRELERQGRVQRKWSDTDPVESELNLRWSNKKPEHPTGITYIVEL